MAETHFTHYAASAGATQALAARLAALCQNGDCLTLTGELGAGKTCFARGFIQALLAEPEDIVSPTFTLLQTYRTQDGTPVWHFDLYRVQHAAELLEIGLQDALESGIVLIEWPEIAESWLPESCLRVRLCDVAGAPGRQIAITSASSAWQERLAALEKLL